MRYFFHVMGGSSPIEDEEGITFPNTSDAVAHARIIANDLAGDGDQYRGYAIVVMDDSGKANIAISSQPSGSVAIGKVRHRRGRLEHRPMPYDQQDDGHIAYQPVRAGHDQP